LSNSQHVFLYIFAASHASNTSTISPIVSGASSHAASKEATKASHIKAAVSEGAARSIAALLVCWRIVIDEHTLDPEIRELLVACMAQEQRLTAVTDEYKRVVGDFQLAHVRSLQLKPASADKLWW
jgi:hypothetical protein